MSVIDIKHFLSTLLLLVGDLYLNLVTMQDIILLSKIGECCFFIFLILLLNNIAHSQCTRFVLQLTLRDIIFFLVFLFRKVDFYNVF